MYVCMYVCIGNVLLCVPTHIQMQIQMHVLIHVCSFADSGIRIHLHAEIHDVCIYLSANGRMDGWMMGGCMVIMQHNVMQCNVL